MKNSVWYHKLWSKKLNKLPIKKSSDSGWEGMRHLLDQHMPNEVASETPSKPSSGSKLWALVSYVLPAAAAISALSYISLSDRSPHKPLSSTNNEIKAKSEDRHIEEVASVLEHVAYNTKLGDQTSQLVKEQAKTELSDMLLPEEVDTPHVAPPIIYYPIYPNEVVDSVNTFPQNSETELKSTEHKKAKRKRVWEFRKLSLNPSGYNVEAGLNLGLLGNSLYTGMTTDFPVNDKWYLNVGLLLNVNQQLKGEFKHPSFYRPDSSRYSFAIQDERKLMVLDVPVKVNYRLSDLVSIHTGLLISLPVAHSSVSTKLGVVADRRDTLYQSKIINAALADTKVSRVHFGLSGGVKLHVKQFDFTGSYQIQTPYQVKNYLGSFTLKQQYFRLGVGYAF